MTEPIWFDVGELAVYLDTPVNTLLCWRKQGRGPDYYRFGRRVRYARTHVDAWIASCAVGKPADGALVPRAASRAATKRPAAPIRHVEDGAVTWELRTLPIDAVKLAAEVQPGELIYVPPDGQRGQLSRLPTIDRDLGPLRAALTVRGLELVVQNPFYWRCITKPTARTAARAGGQRA